ncbi:MAG: hypothetical protein BGP12_22590 [Rhodospirillales bacterium 70-18]|nr:hypothetical protein [Rhodospirillales bacterium]OJY70509.1 MAG: hypothetical protein BGP12_22590 [Rhodospirillales bacterium 70-18]
MSILTVGVGQAYTSLGAAVAASSSFDTINVLAGDYHDDFTTITHALTINGIGGLAHFIADSAPPNGKAIMTVGADLTIDHLEFSGAAVSSGNGAGIRYQGGQLTINNSWFHNNQEGLLAGAVAGGTISIDHSEFDHNGTGDGLTHNLYVSNIATLTVTNSYFHDVSAGHEIKSRAQATILTGNRIQDGPNLSASYSVDLPDGGAATITGNVIEKGVLAQNTTFIHIGGEANPSYPNTALTLSGNTVINDLASGTPLLVRNATVVGGSPVTVGITGNTLYGLQPAELTNGPVLADNNSFLALPGPALDTSHPWDGSAPATVPEPFSAAILLPALAIAAVLRRRHARRLVSGRRVASATLPGAPRMHAAW